MNHPRSIENEQAVLKLCPFCGGYVQGRGETLHAARIALRSAMVWHVEDEHSDPEEGVG